MPERNFPLHPSRAWCGERRVGHLLALEPFSSSPAPSHRLGAAQTCPTIAQVIVPALIPISDSQSPSPLQPPLCLQLTAQTPILPPGCHPHPALFSSALKSSPIPPFSSTARTPRPTNNAPVCYRCSLPAQLNSWLCPAAPPFPNPVLPPTAPYSPPSRSHRSRISRRPIT